MGESPSIAMGSGEICAEWSANDLPPSFVDVPVLPGMFLLDVLEGSTLFKPHPAYLSPLRGTLVIQCF